MKSLVATAPGKLVLCGEYAVLDGAPAISAAVDRRARVAVCETGDGGNVEVRTVGFNDGVYSFRATDSGLTAVGEQGALPLLESAWSSSQSNAAGGMSLELETGAFFASSDKHGLGSSAALTVKIAKALAAWSGSDAGVEARTGMIHSHLQEGRGSGVDIATSTVGGLICFESQRLDEADSTATTRSSVGHIKWPAGVEAAVLFSGIAASTPAKLARLGSQSRLPISDRLVEAAAGAADAWQQGNADQVLHATARFAQTLAKFSDAYGLDVFGGGHAALAELAQARGLVYKPCGAGGGDIGVVLGDDAAAIARFAERAAASGFVALDVRLGGKTEVEGLAVEWTHD